MFLRDGCVLGFVCLSGQLYLINWVKDYCVVCFLCEGLSIGKCVAAKDTGSLRSGDVFPPRYLADILGHRGADLAGQKTTIHFYFYIFTTT